MIFKYFMAFALDFQMILILLGHLMSMYMLDLRSVQASKIMEELLFSKSNEFVSLLDKRVSSSHLLTTRHRSEFLFIVFVKLLDLFRVVLCNHLFIVFRSVAQVVFWIVRTGAFLELLSWFWCLCSM
jgi:hypothetical protein